MSGLKMFIRIIFTIAVICAIASSCEKITFLPPPPPDTTKYLSFDTIIKPIFTKDGCIICHGGTQDPNLKNDPYDALISGGFLKRSDSLDPQASIFYNWITTNSDHIPRTSTSDKANILLWIKQGVRNN
jgi:hypothetical protein